MPRNIILHSDLNCFYASVEINENPSLRNKAIAVCGSTENRHGIVLTASYPAKRRGVKTGMISSLEVATVALIQLVASMSLQNASGLPNSPWVAWAAIAFHMSQDSPRPFSRALRSGAWVWSP